MKYMNYGYIGYYGNESNDNIEELYKLQVSKERIFIDKSINETELNELLKIITNGDILIIPENSMITSKQLCKIIKFAQKKHFKFILGTKKNFIVDCSKENLDDKTIGILETINNIIKLEREVNSRRIKNGVARRKENGKTIGRPPITYDTLPDKVKKFFSVYESGEIGQAQYAKMCNVSRPSIIKYINIIREEKYGDEENL